MRAAAGGGDQIVLRPGGGWAVDAQQDLAAAITALLERGEHLGASRLLGIGRDRVLEIEDQPVGGQGAGLVERARVGSRHIENGTTRANGRGHGVSFWRPSP